MRSFGRLSKLLVSVLAGKTMGAWPMSVTLLVYVEIEQLMEFGS